MTALIFTRETVKGQWSRTKEFTANQAYALLALEELGEISYVPGLMNAIKWHNSCVEKGTHDKECARDCPLEYYHFIICTRDSKGHRIYKLQILDPADYGRLFW
jgi:hypothetical protein